MKRVLVTGGTGFIGGHLTRRLLGQGCDVTVISRREPVPAGNLSGKVTFFQADLSQPGALDSLSVDYDYVFHLAAVRDALNERECRAVNVEGTRNLLAHLSRAKHKPGKVIHVSSLGACGLSNDGKARKETDPREPASVYGRAKMQGEEVVESFSDKLPCVIARPCKVYGPGDRKILLHFRMVRKGFFPAIGLEPRRLSLCYVHDLVDALIILATQAREGETYFIADGNEYSWDDLYQAIARTLDRKVSKILIPERLLDVSLPFLKRVSPLFPKSFRPEPTTFEELRWRNWLCDSSKFRADFPQAPRTDLEAGLRATAGWFASERLL